MKSLSRDESGVSELVMLLGLVVVILLVVGFIIGGIGLSIGIFFGGLIGLGVGLVIFGFLVLLASFFLHFQKVGLYLFLGMMLAGVALMILGALGL